jgi:hypothetical protein
MAFTPVDLPIQEMLQTDFITDLASIHNSNVLLLKDKLEDIINNFEIDSNTISIGTDNPVNSIKSQDIIIQDGGFIFQTGIPNQIIARLSKNGSDESVLNIDNLTVDVSADLNEISINDATVNNTLTVTESSTFNGPTSLNSQIIESKETVTAQVTRDGSTASTATGVINLTNTSKRNIYVTLEMETDAIVADQVFQTSGSFVSGINEFLLSLDFDVNNPPAQNTSFTIYIVDVVRKDTGASILTEFNSIPSVKFTIEAGTNQSTSSPIITHHDLASTSQRLGWDFGSLGDLRAYGVNATFNYIVDADTNDRLIINSTVGLDIIV